MAFCGIRSVNLHEDPIKIPGIHCSYNNQLKNDENFKGYIAKIENVLKLWRTRNLSLEGKITVFKLLTLSKITHMALLKILPPSVRWVENITTLRSIKQNRIIFKILRKLDY